MISTRGVLGREFPLLEKKARPAGYGEVMMKLGSIPDLECIPTVFNYGHIRNIRMVVDGGRGQSLIPRLGERFGEIWDLWEGLS